MQASTLSQRPELSSYTVQIQPASNTPLPLHAAQLLSIKLSALTKEVRDTTPLPLHIGHSDLFDLGISHSRTKTGTIFHFGCVPLGHNAFTASTDSCTEHIIIILLGPSTTAT
jgi:hypothetical protein